MDLSKFKEALPEELFAELETQVSEVINQRDEARNESIEGRRKLKGTAATLEQQNAVLLEKLGVETFEEAEELPAHLKGTADQAKQLEAKLKRAEREAAQLKESYDALFKENRNRKQRDIVSEAMRKHEFIADDVILDHVANRLTWEEDDLLYRQEDGRLISVADGVSLLAKSRPELVKAAGAGGAGVKPSRAGGNAGEQTMTREEFNALTQEKRAEFFKHGGKLSAEH